MVIFHSNFLVMRGKTWRGPCPHLWRPPPLGISEVAIGRSERHRFISTEALKPEENTQDGNVCNDDEEMVAYGGHLRQHEMVSKWVSGGYAPEKWMNNGNFNPKIDSSAGI